MLLFTTIFSTGHKQSNSSKSIENSNNDVLVIQQMIRDIDLYMNDDSIDDNNNNDRDNNVSKHDNDHHQKQKQQQKQQQQRNIISTAQVDLLYFLFRLVIVVTEN